MFFLDNFLKGIKPRYDDDLVDRLNYYYTATILVVFALTLSAKQYVGQPIQCWVPAQFTGAWEQYSENYCFVQNTYWLPLTKYIPKSYAERDAREIGYYQWVPFVLALQALMFFMPALIWRMLNWQSGINVKALVRMALDTDNVEAETRDKNVKILAAHIQDCLDLQRELKGRNRVFGFLFYGKHYGSYVNSLYIFVKFLYLVNVIGQFFLLNSFLGFPDHRFWGFEILRDLSQGREWHESGHFPRVTMCDFEVRVLGNLHRHTIQCVLMINMFNEKIFLFLWWWFMLVAIFTVFSLLSWLWNLVGPRERTFVMRYLRVTENLQNTDKKLVGKFIRNSLRPDGVFLLRIIAANAGDILATDLIHSLWVSYRQRYPAVPGNNDKPTDPGFTESLYPPRKPNRAGEEQGLLEQPDNQ